MKRIIILCSLFFAIGSAFAQNTWDLNKCIQYAKEQNISVQKSKNDMQTAEVNLNTARNSRLPEVSGNAYQNVNFGFTQTAVGTYSKQNTASTQLSLNAGLRLYGGSYISNSIKYNDWSLKAATEDINQIENDVTISITLAYLQVLYNKEIVKVSEENVAQSTEQLKKTQKLVDGERLSISELYESKAQLAKDEYSLTKAKSDLQLSLLDLAQLMELPSIEGFDVEVPNIGEIAISSDAIAAINNDNIENAYTFRPAIKAAEYRLEAGEANIRMMKSAYYPTLNLVGSYGNSYYYIMNPLAGYSNESFSSQISNHGQTTVGLQLNVPIFSRFQNRNQVNLAKVQLNQNKLSLTNAKKTLYKDMQQGYYNAMSAQERFSAAQKSLEASEVAFKYAKEKFDAGRATVFETNEILKRLVNSQSDVAQAKYEYIFRTKLLDYYLGKSITL